MFKIELREDQVNHLLKIIAWVKEEHRKRISGGDIARHAHEVAHFYIAEIEATIREQTGAA